MRIVCVLKSGGAYNTEHVTTLVRGLSKHIPGHGLTCLSDVAVPCERIKLQYDWRGWWSKMELFRPDIDGDLLFFDLDTVIVRDIRHFADVCRTTMLSDFYLKERPASGLMYLAEEDRVAIWEDWIKDPAHHMRKAAAAGDQGYLRRHDTIASAARWQDLFPGQVISYKVHIRTKKGDRDLPEESRVVCFHGSPRPWQIKAPWLEEQVDGHTAADESQAS